MFHPHHIIVFSGLRKFAEIYEVFSMLIIATDDDPAVSRRRINVSVEWMTTD